MACRLSSRSMRTLSGSGNASGSRLAAGNGIGMEEETIGECSWVLGSKPSIVLSSGEHGAGGRHLRCPGRAVGRRQERHGQGGGGGAREHDAVAQRQGGGVAFNSGATCPSLLWRSAKGHCTKPMRSRCLRVAQAIFDSHKKNLVMRSTKYLLFCLPLLCACGTPDAPADTAWLPCTTQSLMPSLT